MTSSPDLAARRLLELGELLAEARDIVSARVVEPDPPAWAFERGLTDALLALDDASVERAERQGPARTLAECEGLPPEFRQLAERAADAVARLPRRAAAAGASTASASAAGGRAAASSVGSRHEAAPLRRASPAKAAQIAALAALASELLPPGPEPARSLDAGLDTRSSAGRVVDFGAGRGHFTRGLASALSREALGLERRADVVATARGIEPDARVAFEVADALEPRHALSARDIAVGLHPCGALSDEVTLRAAEAGAGLLLVACCPQKIPGERRLALSEAGRSVGLTLDRVHLGLANVWTGAHGIEEAMARRRRRRALLLLLRDAGLELTAGDEARGLPRRQLRHPLERVAKLAFGRRGLPAPSPAAIANAEARAAVEHRVMRRLALPRAMFARPLELALAYDRAALLGERGAAASVTEAFGPEISPRSVVIHRPPSCR